MAELEFFDVHLPGMLPAALRAAELAEQVNDPRAEMQAHYWASIALAQEGRLDEASRHAEAAVATAERLRHHFYLTRALYGRAWLASWQGEWDQGLAWARRGLKISPFEPRLLYITAVLETQRGEFSAARECAQRLIDRFPAAPGGAIIERAFAAFLIPVHSHVSGDVDLLDRGEEAYRTGIGGFRAIGRIAEFIRDGLCLVAVIRGDRHLATDEYQALLADEHRIFIAGPNGLCRDRLLGLLARTVGRLDEAVGHFEDALAFCARAGYRPGLAWSLYEYADTLLTMGRDRRQAMTLLDEGLKISRELGMRPLMDRILARREVLSA